MNAFRRWRDRHWNFNASRRDAWVAANARNAAPGSRVLDAGAGPGRYRSLFSHCRYEAHDFALEPSTAGNYTELDYISDITAISAPDGTFDVVLCTEVLEHVPEPIEGIRELARLLRDGGTLLLTAPLGSHLHQQPFHFYGGFTPHWYRRFLPAAGLTVTAIEPNLGFFSMFGQETIRCRLLLSPMRTRNLGLAQRTVATALWLPMMIFSQLLPWAAPLLDGGHLEDSATVGYFVTAVKQSGAPGP
jgi:SAM-dependent methyltransferase